MKASKRRKHGRVTMKIKPKRVPPHQPVASNVHYPSPPKPETDYAHDLIWCAVEGFLTIRGLHAGRDEALRQLLSHVYEAIRCHLLGQFDVGVPEQLECLAGGRLLDTPAEVTA